MVRGQRKMKDVLSIGELDSLKQERNELENMLREGEGYGAGTKGEQIDEGAIKRQIAKISASIAEGTPGRLTAKQKDSLIREANELEERFKEGLPTRYEMDHPGKCPGAVRKHMKWLSRNEHTGYVNRYRQIQRLVNPGDEKSIESLRVDK